MNDKEKLREQMITSFHIFSKTNPLKGQMRQQTWDDYCLLREAYLRETLGKSYLALHQTIRLTGPYN